MEAIVSLVLIATTGMALFSWVNSNITTLQRVMDNNARSAATQNALQYLQNINPMTTPEGHADLGTYHITWAATPATEPRDGAGYPVGTGYYQMALYQTQVKINKTDDQAWFAFEVQQLGYKKVRKSMLPF